MKWLFSHIKQLEQAKRSFTGEKQFIFSASHFALSLRHNLFAVSIWSLHDPFRWSKIYIYIKVKTWCNGWPNVKMDMSRYLPICWAQIAKIDWENSTKINNSQQNITWLSVKLIKNNLHPAILHLYLNEMPKVYEFYKCIRM